MKKALLLLLATFLLLCGLLDRASWSKVYIDIRSPSFRKFPLAVAPFRAVSSQAEMRLGDRVTDILNDDLNITGFFSVIDGRSAGALGSQAAEKGVENVDFQGWSGSGAEALVIGEVTYKENALVLEARLYDVVKKEMILGKRYTGEIHDLSRMVHRFADEVVFALTGEQGFFQTKIVYVSQATGKKEISLMDFDGRNATRLTHHNSICLSPRFSPDGTRIAFTSYKSGNPDIYIKDLRTGAERRAFRYPGLNISPSWSPDGQRLAMTLSKDGNSEIYTARLDGSDLQRVTDHPGIDVSPTWSPDGRRIAFVSNRGGTPQIYAMDASGQNVQRLTFEGTYNTHPSWSPRGDRIAFDATVRGEHNICTIQADGANFKVLTANLSQCEMPSWSPDGRNLVFSSNRNGVPNIYLIDAEGTRIKRLTFEKGGDTYPNWSPRFKE